LISKDINTSGVVCGVLMWFIYIFGVISQTACLKAGYICGGFDMLILAINAVGGLAPAYIAALIGSTVFGSKK